MSRSSACRRAATGLLCALGAGLATAGPASAGAPDQLWNCRASAGYDAVPDRDRDEPVVANGSSRTTIESPDRARCADDDGKPTGAGDPLGLEGPTAKTSIDPDSGLAVDQHVSARSSANNFAPGDPNFSLLVHGASAEATGVCTAGGPSLAGSSVVPVVRINGQEIDTTQGKQTVTTLPSGEVVTTTFNEQTRSGGTLTQRAVHSVFRNQAGEVVREMVAAEARVSGGSEVCDRAAQEATAAGNDGSGSQNPCITGAEYDAARNLCVITRERDGNLANGRETVTVVGRPYAGPSGGRVVLPSEAPKSEKKSTCLKRKGLKFLILGSKRADRITGSNRSDVIFGLGGKDKISGGRGSDCIVGGKGDDRLAGAQGKDTLIGGAGRDKLDGGPDGDKLNGGSGRDYINSANGRDKVSGGKGNDAINVATAGPAAKVKCGKGKDTVRYNHNERRRVKGCERRYSIK
jgi:Ca2+-binding RTX toxin-like protein